MNDRQCAWQQKWYWLATCGRDAYGVPLLVDLLGGARPGAAGLAAAACDALTALAAGNAANKAAVRDAWALPLLVRLLGQPVRAPNALLPNSARVLWRLLKVREHSAPLGQPVHGARAGLPCWCLALSARHPGGRWQAGREAGAPCAASSGIARRLGARWTPEGERGGARRRPRRCRSARRAACRRLSRAARTRARRCWAPTARCPRSCAAWAPPPARCAPNPTPHPTIRQLGASRDPSGNHPQPAGCTAAQPCSRVRLGTCLAGCVALWAAGRGRRPRVLLLRRG